MPPASRKLLLRPPLRPPPPPPPPATANLCCPRATAAAVASWYSGACCSSGASCSPCRRGLSSPGREHLVGQPSIREHSGAMSPGPGAGEIDLIVRNSIAVSPI